MWCGKNFQKQRISVFLRLDANDFKEHQKDVNEKKNETKDF